MGKHKTLKKTKAMEQVDDPTPAEEATEEATEESVKINFYRPLSS